MHQPPAALAIHASADSHDWKKDVYIWLPLACLSWALAWKFQDEFISDWDGFDYTAYTVRHLPSALGLGRALFLGYNYLLWEAAHRWLEVPPEQAYLALRYGVIAQAGPAIVGMYALCKELTGGKLAAFLGALLLAASPFFILYSGRAMSEIPGFLMLGWSLWWMLRGLRRGLLRERTAGFLLAAAFVGLSANLREFAVFYLPFLPIAARLHGVKWRFALAAPAIAALCAIAGMSFWLWYDDYFIHVVANWVRLTAQERRMHPVTIDNVRFFAAFAFNCSAAAAMLAPLALVWLWARRNLRLLWWLGCFGLLADLALLANHDLAVNPRYLLTGMVGLAPVCGWCLAELIKQRRAQCLPLLLGLVVLTKGTYNHMAKQLYDQQWSARAARDYIDSIIGLPWNASFIVGSRTPLVNFLAGVGARPHWLTISSGSNWPDDKLDDAIREFFYAGRAVYVDFDPELWQAGARENSREAAGLARIKQRYKLQHIRDSFYRIVARNDDP